MNYETRCVKIKLKPNSLEKAREWARTINEQKDEALATLRNESVILETAFRSKFEGDFLIYVMKAEIFQKARESVQQSVHSIDEYHQNFKRECWENGVKLEMLIDLDRISEIK